MEFDWLGICFCSTEWKRCKGKVGEEGEEDRRRWNGWNTSLEGSTEEEHHRGPGFPRPSLTEGLFVPLPAIISPFISLIARFRFPLCPRSSPSLPLDRNAMLPEPEGSRTNERSEGWPCVGPFYLIVCKWKGWNRNSQRSSTQLITHPNFHILSPCLILPFHSSLLCSLRFSLLSPPPCICCLLFFQVKGN